MPWSPLQYTEKIFLYLSRRGMSRQCTTDALWNAIMEETKLIRGQTISNVLKAFERLGYITRDAPNVWNIKYWDDKGGVPSE